MAFSLKSLFQGEAVNATLGAHKEWMTWVSSDYCREMRRRVAYYKGVQFRQSAAHIPFDEFDVQDWNNLWSGFGWEDLRAMLPDATEWNAVKPDGLNITETMITNIAVAYTLPVDSRKVLVEGEANEEASALYDKILEGAGFNANADQHCKMVFLCDTSFQVFSWDARYLRLEVTNLTPDLVMVRPSKEAPLDIQHPDCRVSLLWRYPLPHEQETDVIWQVWEGSEYWYEGARSGEWKDLGLTTPGRNANPYVDMLGYPVKPILVSHAKPPEQIHAWESDGLVMAAQRVDRNLTAVAWTLETQGFAVPEVKGMTYEELQRIGYGPGAPFVVDASADPNAGINFKHPLAPIGEVMNASIRHLRLVAQTRGIDPDLVDPDKKVASGTSTAQGRLALKERRDQQFPKWLPYEREVYWIVSTMWNTHVTVPRLRLPEIPRFRSPLSVAMAQSGEMRAVRDITLEVVFGELDPVVDPLADAFAKKARVDLGLNDVPEFIMTERGVTRKRAEELYDTHMALKRKVEAEGVTTFESFRIGQSGNRPLDPSKPSEKGNTTAASGNRTLVEDEG